jgi:hypothetical protein
MKPMVSKTLVVALLAVLAALASPHAAHACAVCFGDPESPMTQGLNKGILTLLGFIALVQVGIVRIVWTMRQRSRSLADPFVAEPSSAEPTSADSTSADRSSADRD